MRHHHHHPHPHDDRSKHDDPMERLHQARKKIRPRSTHAPPISYQHQRSLRNSKEAKFANLRIRYDTTVLDHFLSDSTTTAEVDSLHETQPRTNPNQPHDKTPKPLPNNADVIRARLLKESILPTVAQIWSHALQVLPIQNHLILDNQTLHEGGSCLDPSVRIVPQDHITQGIDNTDLLVYVSASSSNVEELEQGCPNSYYARSTSNTTHPPPTSTSTSTSNSVLASAESRLNSRLQQQKHKNWACTVCARAAGTLAFASACNLDSWDRPVAGAIHFCMSEMHPIVDLPKRTDFVQSTPLFTTTTNTNSTTALFDAQAYKKALQTYHQTLQKTTQTFLRVALHEMAHVLGYDPEMLKFFRHPQTGLPRTPRPFVESKRQTVPCVNDNDNNNGNQAMEQEEEEGIVLPSRDTLQFGQTKRGVRYAEIVTERVATVVRNHFHCHDASLVKGARLENQSRGGHCFGGHFDERLFFNEQMSSHISIQEPPTNTNTNTQASLSPLTLAYFEDSGWYRANYTSNQFHLQISSWGHGAGCDFVVSDCIVNGSVPEYGLGFFCNSSRPQKDPAFYPSPSYHSMAHPHAYGCTPGHTHKATCNLVDYTSVSHLQLLEKKYQYFESPSLAGKLAQVDFCPVWVDHPLSCLEVGGSSGDGQQEKEGVEKFGPESRCFVTVDGPAKCLEAKCDETSRKIWVKVGNEWNVCGYDGEELKFNQGLVVVCPRLTAFCPQLFCPNNCSGRGICHWDSHQNNNNTNTNTTLPQHPHPIHENSTKPTCQCFDPSDTSPSCDKAPVLAERNVYNGLLLDPLASDSSSSAVVTASQQSSPHFWTFVHAKQGIMHKHWRTTTMVFAAVGVMVFVLGWVVVVVRRKRRDRVMVVEVDEVDSCHE